MVKSAFGRSRYFVARLYLGKDLFLGYGWTEEHARTAALKTAKKVKGRRVDLQTFDRVEVKESVGPAPRGLTGKAKNVKPKKGGKRASG